MIRAENEHTEISSHEGTTQGCNLGMLFYALGVTPVVRDLDRLIKEMEGKVRQCWLADDSSAAGTLEGIRIW